MASSFADIQAKGRRIVQFTGLESYGLELYCGSISEQESADLEASLWKPGTTQIDPGRLKTARRKLLALTVCDERGNNLLTADQAATIDSKLADLLHTQAQAHVQERKSKNSPLASEGGSPSDSQQS